MIGPMFPFAGVYDSVSLFSRTGENKTGNIRFLARKIYLDILLLKTVSIAVLIILKWFLGSHNLLYIINPVHVLLIKTICYLIWFVFIRRGYIIGHKTPMEKFFSNNQLTRISEYLNKLAKASFSLLVLYGILILAIHVSLFL